jgi:hypothetical protein
VQRIGVTTVLEFAFVSMCTQDTRLQEEIMFTFYNYFFVYTIYKLFKNESRIA